MKTLTKNKQSNKSGTYWWLLWTSALTALYFNSKIQDPFNAPKMWILLMGSAWLVGHLISYKEVFISSNKNLLISGLNLFFLISLIFASFTTDNKYNAIFGENQRRNGLLTYFALIVILLSAFVLVNFSNLKFLYLVGFVTGSLMSAYGLLQTFGIDFIKWNNPYNSVISTVGNPNFAAALLAVFGTLIFTNIFNSAHSQLIRLVSFITFLILVFTIYRSGARQGLISIIIGITSVFLVWIYQKNRIIGITSLIVSVISGLFAVLGMLQIGPLAELLYKGSVTVRGYYWAAGLEMFKNNFWTGIGIDRFGQYFKEYRDVQYPLKYGFEITSSNAHNVPIQMFATGGIFLGLSYLMLLVLVAWLGLDLIKKTNGSNKILSAGIFGSWLAFQAQSLISIDNIGISIWGWLLSGTILGLSRNVDFHPKNSTDQVTRTNKTNLKILQPLVSGTLLLVAIILVSILYKGESSMFQTRGKFNPSDTSLNEMLHQSAIETINTPLVEPSYKINSAAYLVATGYSKEGLEVLTELNKNDPRNLDTLSLLADFSQQMGNLEVSNSYRLKIGKLDPWNAKNYLQLGRNYKTQGQFEKMQEMKTLILSFASSTAEAEAAKLELN